MKRFAYCNCFLASNVFVKTWNRHVKFESPSQFKHEYEGENNLEEALAEAEREVERRCKLRSSVAHRRKEIEEKYSPIFPKSFTPFLNIINTCDDRFHQQFLKALKNSKSDKNQVLPSQVGPNTFCLPIFTEKFCRDFVSEMKNFKITKLPHEKPNSMNDSGVLLDDLPFLDDFLNDLRSALEPIFQSIFPDYLMTSLDSHKAFVVHYSAGSRDIDLAPHFDNAEVTVNISLTDVHEGGDLVFKPNDESKYFGYEHKLGVGLLHLGSLEHQALPVTSGDRWNLILWLRSSGIRNKLCPMCKSTPDLVAAPAGSYGDGFTISETLMPSQVCVLS